MHSFEKEEKKRLNGYYQRNDYTKARYGKESMKYYAQRRTIKINKIIKNKFNKQNVSILDVGCGTGVLIKQLNKLNRKYTLTGLDFSDNMLKNSVLNSDELNHINLVQGSAFKMPFNDNNFDIVICTRFIHQYTNELKKVLIREMKRLTKKNGIVIIEFYSSIIGLIKYIEKKLKNSFDSEEEIKSDSYKEFFKHYNRKKDIRVILDTNIYEIEPIILPLHSKITKLIGLSNFKKINRITEKLGVKYLFSQYLIVITK